MVTTAVNLPSINIPFTDGQGRINPIWHEFLRSFVNGSVAGTITSPSVAPQILANNGLVGGGPVTSDVPLRVGQGSGIAVNADDVSVDIAGTTYKSGALDDEVLISNPMDNNNIRRTSLRDVVALVPTSGASAGGSPTQIQYNSGGSFAGDSGFTTNGSGTVSASTLISAPQMNPGNLTITGQTIANTQDAVDLTLDLGGTSSTGNVVVTRNSNSNATQLRINSLQREAILSLRADTLNSGTSGQCQIDMITNGGLKWRMYMDDPSFDFSLIKGAVTPFITCSHTNETIALLKPTSLYRSTNATITASTTQTQGQGALTAMINEVSTVANANDTVTLPTAVAGLEALVINNGANTLQVFPASGDNLGAGLNTSTTIVAGSRKLFMAFDATNWEPVI